MKRSFTLFWRTMLARAYPRVIAIRREPTWVLQETLLPVLSVAAYAFVYRALGADTYVGFVILGGVMTAFWLNVLWAMGATMYWDRDAGNLELYIMAPASLTAVLAGMALGGMVATLMRATVIVLLGSWLFDVHLAPSSWVALVSVFLLTMLALYGLGMVFASAFLLWGRGAWHLVTLMQEPVYLASGMNFPIKTLGTVVASIAAALPLTIGVDALRQLLFGETANGLLPVWLEIILLVVLSAGFLALAWFCLRYLESKARQEGRLTVKWQ
jgi:ABC-2 type transport system permease protein